MKILGVLIEHGVFNNTPFSYLANDDQNISIGFRVLVPFSKQKIVGYVISITTSSLSFDEICKKDNLNYKFILSVLDKTPILNDELFNLAIKMSNDYITPLISCLKTILPPAYKPSSTGLKNVHKKIIYKLTAKENVNNITLTEKQKEIYDYILKQKEVLYSSIKNKNILKKLIDLDLLNKIPIVKNNLDIYDSEKTNNIVLNSQQQQVVNEFLTSDDCVYLLQGVTGSGKTEVYLEIVDYYLKKGKTAIILVPEISLTPMIISRFKERFNNIAVLHGSLSTSEKNYQYNRIKNQEVQVVIGARSAIFAPLENIGVIILDEEQSLSYKQDNSPTYHARDIAIIRAKFHNCKVLLGSATPSFESKARSIKKVYHPLFLNKRANNLSLPKVEIVDMRKDYLQEGVSLLSKSLDTAIKKCLDNKQKIILLHNRRGYSPYVYCRNCGYSFKCPTCEVSMCYHKKENKFKCHYCNHEVVFNHECPKCHEHDFLYIGSGTQKIEEIFAFQYPNAKILRMDMDTTKIKDGHYKILKQFENEDYNILLGTQMVAKGLNFKDVTLVGIIDGDITLNAADFRSAELTFELLSQVAGRAGRGSIEGQVIIQTYNPDHYAIKLAAKHDYESFFKQDMAFRHRRNYPPFSYLCSINVLSTKPENSIILADRIFAELNNFKDFELLGPALPYIYKENIKYKVRIVVKSKNKELMIKQFNIINEKFYQESKELKCTIHFDIDAYQLL